MLSLLVLRVVLLPSLGSALAETSHVLGCQSAKLGLLVAPMGKLGEPPLNES